MTVFARKGRPGSLEDLVAEVQVRLAGRTEVRAVWVFGSCAGGGTDRYGDRSEAGDA